MDTSLTAPRPAADKPGYAPAYAAVLEWIEGQLAARTLRVGDKLPGERALAQQFGISRTSVREAIRILDSMGLIETRTGSGPRSGATITGNPAPGMSWALRLHAAARTFPVNDLVSTRILLEGEAARAAAQASGLEAAPPAGEVGATLPAGTVGATPPTPSLGAPVLASPNAPAQRSEILAQASATLELLEDPTIDAAEFHRLDQVFHCTLARLAGNPVIDTLLASLSASTITYVSDTVARRDDWPTIKDRLNEQHRAILDATIAWDGPAAAERIREHILWFYGIVQHSHTG